MKLRLAIVGAVMAVMAVMAPGSAYTQVDQTDLCGPTVEFAKMVIQMRQEGVPQEAMRQSTEQRLKERIGEGWETNPITGMYRQVIEAAYLWEVGTTKDAQTEASEAFVREMRDACLG